MAKFRKGDRVSITYLCGLDEREGLKVGQIGVVDEDSICPYVLFVGQQDRYAMDEDQLELVQEAEPLDVEDVADAVFETYFADDVLDVASETSVIFTIPLEEALGAISSYLSEKHGGLSVTLEGFSPTTTGEGDEVLLLSGTVL